MLKYWRLFFPLLIGLLTLGAGCIKVGGSTAAGPMGVFRSDDKGDTWKSAMTYPTAQGVKSIAGLKVYRVFNDPSDPNSLYLATRGQGLFYTYNNGATWQFAEGLGVKFIYGVAVDPRDKCTVYVIDEQHVFKTNDCSRTWQAVYSEERPQERLVSVTIDAHDSNKVYAGSVGGDIFASVDGGTSWRAIKRFGFQIQQVTSDQFVAGRLYVGSYQNGLFRSDDGGNTWEDLRQGMAGFSGSLSFYRLVQHPTKQGGLFWISKYGILRSDDSGSSWTDLKLITPPGSVNIYSFAVGPTNDKELYYTGTILGENQAHVRSTFYKSMDGGITWVTKKLPTNTIPIGLYIHPRRPTLLLMAFTLVN
jgi:photosystem II stability/assembly factor-like uncharacterized protein